MCFRLSSEVPVIFVKESWPCHTCSYANEIEFCILQELAYRNFIKFAGVFAIVSQFNDLEFLPSGSEKANSFAGVFSENSNFDDTGHSPLV